jgi:hypothetical protein
VSFPEAGCHYFFELYIWLSKPEPDNKSSEAPLLLVCFKGEMVSAIGCVFIFSVSLKEITLLATESTSLSNWATGLLTSNLGWIIVCLLS